jgi:hypothetical protein
VLRLFEDGTLTETPFSDGPGSDLRKESEKSSNPLPGRFFVDGEVLHTWTKWNFHTEERMGTIREGVLALRGIINGRSAIVEDRFEFVQFRPDQNSK